MLEWLPLRCEDSMTSQDNISWVNIGVWEKIRIVIGLVLVAAISYEMGLAHARSERSIGEYSALLTQYGRVLTEYSASKAQCAETLTQYSALKAQYDRIEAQRTRTPVNAPKMKP